MVTGMNAPYLISCKIKFSSKILASFQNTPYFCSTFSQSERDWREWIYIERRFHALVSDIRISQIQIKRELIATKASTCGMTIYCMQCEQTIKFVCSVVSIYHTGVG